MKAKFLSLLLCLMVLSGATASPLKVVFINPGHPQGDDTGAFWSNVNRFMQAAANDLDIELLSLHAKRNHLLMKQLADDAARLKPDYAIIVNEKSSGLDVAHTLMAHNIPVFMLLNNFSEQEVAGFDESQQALLIGSVIPDNFQAGRSLMEGLLSIHKQKYPMQKSITLIALQGDYSSPASVQRNAGLIDYLIQHPEIQFLDSPVVSWSGEIAYQKIKGLIQRQRIDIIWSANDPIAIGARRAVIEALPDYQVTIGGINWDKPDKQFPIDLSYGGHVVLGAKALVMLADYHAGLRPACRMQR
ncbi:ABC transporter substrate-binding protein [Planctobacterium marinum]|uniref:Periplasmic binding protein domain-containing protein n=1 Tax=Planctobacterium marinum TaxID=1631968 RepID=A0AA48I6S7_9ALTE|nr:hypothetical protein MACH26_25110 [Planctobacterium marinum]